ncbi:unnamed protein product [Rangifer tarandus platyrhynchus]|uniref:Uncharacterized protein n=2 Tax=Rangifer tarandus platyrhynchus TaxID=3082113 RepID=A0ABN8YMZ6_RANTA|nr:unnamed protein product [Rangifer tarandus platyrhynchus]
MTQSHPFPTLSCSKPPWGPRLWVSGHPEHTPPQSCPILTHCSPLSTLGCYRSFWFSRALGSHPGAGSSRGGLECLTVKGSGERTLGLTRGRRGGSVDGGPPG